MPNTLCPGLHTFTSPTKALTFTYSIHSPTSVSTSPSNLLVIQCPAWGIGPEYLKTGLSSLSTTRALLFFHPRGTNGSSFPRPSRMSTMPDLASDLEDLRLHLGLDAFPSLLGHSNGGAIVLGYAEMFPSRVERLVLVCHSLIGVKNRRVENAKNDTRYGDAVEVLRESDPKTDREFTDMVSAVWPLYFFDVRFVDRLRDDIGERAMSLRAWRSLYGCDRADPGMIDGLGRVSAKTLVLFGEDDLVCGPAIARQTAEGIPDSILLGYERCGHFPWIEQKRTLQDIDSFLVTGKISSNSVSQ